MDTPHWMQSANFRYLPGFFTLMLAYQNAILILILGANVTVYHFQLKSENLQIDCQTAPPHSRLEKNDIQTSVVTRFCHSTSSAATAPGASTLPRPPLLLAQLPCTDTHLRRMNVRTNILLSLKFLGSNQRILLINFLWERPS